MKAAAKHPEMQGANCSSAADSHGQLQAPETNMLDRASRMRAAQIAKRNKGGRPPGSGWRQRLASHAMLDETLLRSEFAELLNEDLIPSTDPESNSYLRRLRIWERVAVRELHRAQLLKEPAAINNALRTCLEITDRLGRWTGDHNKADRETGAPPGLNRQVIVLHPVGSGASVPAVEIGRDLTLDATPAESGPNDLEQITDTPSTSEGRFDG